MNVFLAKCIIFAIPFIVTGCVTNTYKYSELNWSAGDQISDEQTSEILVEGTGRGFILSTCKAVIAEAIENMKDEMQAKGVDAVSNIMWLNEDTDEWVREPSCTTEHGWWINFALALIWPRATVAKVRGYAYTTTPGADDNEVHLFRNETPPIRGVVSHEARQERPKAKFLALGFWSVRAGVYTGASTRYALKWEWASVYKYSNSCRPIYHHSSPYSALDVSLRYEEFLGNSFYVAAGPATGVVKKNVDTYCTEPVPYQKRFRGIDVGIGNEWMSDSGIVGGCEWLGEIATREKDLGVGRSMSCYFGKAL